MSSPKVAPPSPLIKIVDVLSIVIAPEASISKVEESISTATSASPPIVIADPSIVTAPAASTSKAPSTTKPILAAAAAVSTVVIVKDPFAPAAKVIVSPASGVNIKFAAAELPILKLSIYPADQNLLVVPSCPSLSALGTIFFVALFSYFYIIKLLLALYRHYYLYPNILTVKAQLLALCLNLHLNPKYHRNL